MLPDLVTEMLPKLSDPKECLRRAERCERLARNADSDIERAALLQLAAHWRAMAKTLKSQAAEHNCV
jgi:hypothetical protein